jgi:sugar phosphate permease
LGIITPTLIEEGILSKNQIGLIQTGYLVVYAAGQFVSGALGDQYGPRTLIFFGMLASGIAALVIGLFPFFGVIFIVYSLNGLAQSTGWSNNCKLISNWVPHSKRGRVMGVWMTNYVIGSITANTLIGYLMGDGYSWKIAVFTCSVIILIMAIIQGIFLINKPGDAGYSITQQNTGNATKKQTKSSFIKMITHPVILIYGGSYLSLKFISYTIFSWFPLYLVETKGFSKSNAAYATNGFEIGGFIGLLIGGILADTLFRNNKGRLAWFALICVALSLFFFNRLNHHGFAMVFTGLSTVGFFLFIADSTLSGTAAQDIGGTENTGSATGIINGIGSIGGALSGILPIWIQQRYGWHSVFLLFLLFSLLAIGLLFPAAMRQKTNHL